MGAKLGAYIYIFQAPERLNSQCEQTSVNLPLEVSSLKPLEASSQLKQKVQAASQPDQESDSQSKEVQPVQVLWKVSSAGQARPPAVLGSKTAFESPPLPTALVSYACMHCYVRNTGMGMKYFVTFLS